MGNNKNEKYREAIFLFYGLNTFVHEWNVILLLFSV